MHAIRGSINQGQVQCRGQGFQYSLFAVTVLLAFYCGQLDLMNLNVNSVDQIVYAWSQLYDKVIHGRPRYLEHRKIPRNIYIFNNAFQLEVYSELFYGVVGQQGNLSAQSYSIQLAIENAFQMSNFHIFTAGGTTISIFASENNIYLFDSHARDSLGNVCHSRGTAVLLFFESTVSLVEYLSNFYANLEYNLSPMSIRIETVDTLGINRESLSAAINSNTGDSRCTHFSPAVIPKCVNYSTKLQSQTVLDHNQACIVSEANKTLCASISSKIDELPGFYSNY